MSSAERQVILQMVAEGKITAEEAATLMRLLEIDGSSRQAETAEVLGGIVGPAGSDGEAPEFAEVRDRARRFAMLPLWMGVFITVLSAWGMAAVQQDAGLNFWFYCLAVPLLLGVLLIVLGAGGGAARWLYVNLDRSQANGWPRNITLGFPLPIELTGWFLRAFGDYIEGLNRTKVDEVIQALSLAKSLHGPLIVNVSDDEGGERVQVFIG